MWAVYYISIQTIGAWGTDWANDTFFGEWVPEWVGSLLENAGCAPWLESLIQDGVIAGVGAVLGFLPQMAVLFLCLGILEDCGYMARVAFIMDRIFRNSAFPEILYSHARFHGVRRSWSHGDPHH